MALLDADDLWEPEFLAHQVALFDRENARDGKVGVVTCDARMSSSTAATRRRATSR